MTETSPLATMAWPQARMRDWPAESVSRGAHTGRRADPGSRVSIRGEDGAEVP